VTYSTSSMIDELAIAHPAVKEMLAEHLDDNYGELLPHVFFGDMVRWVERDAPADEIARVLAELDTCFTNGDEEVQNVILVSFVEALGYRSPFLALLGPALSATEIAKILRGA